MLGRGEWVMNRERLSPSYMRSLAEQFNPSHFDAEQICDLACEAGMKYVNLTTMHHEGFRLYDSELSDFNAKRYTGRDLVEEFVDAAKARNLKVSLYHSLNNWFDDPDSVAALESETAYETFIGKTHERIKELVTRFNPIDCLWYDGWWPFNAEKWQGEKMNAMVREIQPDIIFNGRNGLDGDFGTPEGHMAAPSPWRPWEACMTLNDSWGYHCGDHNWKSAKDVVKLLASAAQGKGSLLLNLGPMGDGSIPAESVQVVRDVGRWLAKYGECIYGTDIFSFGLMERGSHNGDWNHNGPFTLKGKTMYQILTAWPGENMVISGITGGVKSVSLLGSKASLSYEQDGEALRIKGLPMSSPDLIAGVVKIECEEVPSMYTAGGMRVTRADHPPYDPCPSDIQH